MNAGEAPRHNRRAAEQPRRARCMLATAAFAVVVVTNDHPAQSSRAVLPRDVRKRQAVTSVQHVDARPWRAHERIGRAREQSVAESLEVASKSEPGPSRRNVVSGRLATRFEQDWQIHKVTSVPSRPGLHRLEPFTG